MPRNDQFKGSNYRDYTLAKQEHDYSKKYLDKVIDLVETMTSRHSKVLITRADIRYPQSINSDGTNTDFKHLTENITKEYSRKEYDPQFIARREQKKSKNPHLHIAIVVDGSKKRDREKVIQSLEHHWANVLKITEEDVHKNQLIFPCNKDPQGNPRPNGILIERPKQGDLDGMVKYQEAKESAVRQLSYLAKKEADDMTPSSTRKMFSSQFKKDYDTAQEKKAKWRENYYRNRALKEQ